MEIVQAVRGDLVELRLEGRLDALWADHVASAISETIRAGHHRIAIDMAEVDFLSSAGIGVLLRYHKQLGGIGGRLVVIRPSRFVKGVLESMGLASLVGADEVSSIQRTTVFFPESLPVESEHAILRLDPVKPGASLTLRVLGDANRWTRGSCQETDCRPLACRPETFSLGIGVPGDRFDQCRTRFGEFLSVGGAVAFLPTGESPAPDYLLARGTFLPSVQVLHGLSCEGDPAARISFQAKPNRSVSLSELAGQCLDAVNSDTAGIVITAEIDGLVGAWLQRSPAGEENPSDPFAFPQIRDWMRFTPERAFTSEVALVVGVASRAPVALLAPSLRPLDAQGALAGHFHAAAFTYRPLGKRETGMREAVEQLFEWQALRGLLHLVHDARPVEGLGQSEFARGTCWVGAISQVAAGTSAIPVAEARETAPGS